VNWVWCRSRPRALDVAVPSDPYSRALSRIHDLDQRHSYYGFPCVDKIGGIAGPSQSQPTRFAG